MLAENRETVEKTLLNQGVSQIRIQRNFVFATQPTQAQITQLLRQLSLLVTAHIPLKAALLMFKENCTHIRLFLWLQGLIQALEAGFAFSAALEKNSHYLSAQEIQLIKMGETSGNLMVILSNIADAREKSEKLSKKVKKILLYPAVILFISLTLSLLLLIFIVPQFAELYQNKSQSLPLITELLFMLSNILVEQTKSILFAVFLAFILGYLIHRRSTLFTRLKWHILTRLPIFKTIVKQARIIYFCQNCALMLNAHLRLNTILQAFQTDKNSDPILFKEIAFMLTLLQQGYRFYEGLNPAIFDNEAIQMIAIGEQSGNLSQTLQYISEMYQQKLDYQIDLLAQLLEPMLMLVMGIIVGTIMLGLYLPIFDMGALVE